MPDISYEPSGLAVNSAETRLYVADKTNGQVHVYDLTATPYAEIGTGILVGSAPEGLALSPDGTSLYVANSNTPSVSVILTASNTKSTDIPLANGSVPLGLSVSSDNSKVYVSNSNGNNVSVIAVPGYAVTTIAVGTATSNIVVDPSRTNVYAGLFGLSQLGAIAYATNAVSPYGNAGQVSPWGVAITSSGSKLVLTNNQSDSVSIFNPASLGTAPTVVAVGARPLSLGNFIGPEVRTITATAGTGGSITPAGTVYAALNKDKQFSILADAGYRILDVKADTVSKGTLATYTFANVTVDHTVDATFRQIYPVTVISQGSGSGTFAWSSTNLPTNSSCGTTCKNFDIGANISITATPNVGSTWDPASGWSVAGSFCSSISGVNGEICNVNSLSAAKSVVATFGGVSQLDARIKETLAPYAKVSTACAAVANGQTVQATINAVSEDLILAWPYTYTIQGGFDSNYGSAAGWTTLSKLTVSTGTVTISNILLK
jgi:YVTN family beta-propeller protein